MGLGKIDTAGKPCGQPGTWPKWARIAATIAVLAHAGAIWAGAWAADPASPLQRGLAEGVHDYLDLIDQGHGYRYYTDPPPTPVVSATVRYPDGRADEVRLPDRGTRPRLLYQRELALAHSLFMEARFATESGVERGQGPWARSYARHLGKTHPGAKAVTLTFQLHLIPDPARIEEIRREGRAPDLDAPEFYTVPERIGEYPCDAS